VRSPLTVAGAAPAGDLHFGSITPGFPLSFRVALARRKNHRKQKQAAGIPPLSTGKIVIDKMRAGLPHSAPANGSLGQAAQG